MLFHGRIWLSLETITFIHVNWLTGIKYVQILLQLYTQILPIYSLLHSLIFKAICPGMFHLVSTGQYFLACKNSVILFVKGKQTCSRTHPDPPPMFLPLKVEHLGFTLIPALILGNISLAELLASFFWSCSFTFAEHNKLYWTHRLSVGLSLPFSGWSMPFWQIWKFYVHISRTKQSLKWKENAMI